MSSRGIVLIAVAVALCGGLIGVQLAAGGADFVPQRAADPCENRERTPKEDIEGLAETVVLTGLDQAACKLGVTRERLVLTLPSAADRAALAREAGTDERGVAQAVKDGLDTGVDQLEQEGRLPKASALLPSLADELGVPGSVVGLIPDGPVDDLLPTGDVLHRALDEIDVDTILEGLDDPDSLEPALRDALVQGAIDEARGPIEDALPGPLRGLLP